MTKSIQEYRGRTRWNTFNFGHDGIAEKIFSFLDLPDGWHYGSGYAPSLELVLHAINLAHILRTLGCRSLEAFPGISGTIMVSAYGQNSCLDITMPNIREHDYVFLRDGAEVAEKEHVSLDELVETLTRERWLACDLSDSCTRSTTARKRVDSNLWLSRTQTVLEFPSLTRTA